MALLHLVSSVGHPELGLSSSSCEERAHPTRARGAHRSPVFAPEVVIGFFQATPQNRGPFPYRQQPPQYFEENSALATEVYVPGADYMVLLRREVEAGRGHRFEALLTCSHGAFEERGVHGTGWHGTRSGPKTVACDGRRTYSTRIEVMDHLFLWTAPEQLLNVTFNATISLGEYDAFLLAPTLSVAADLDACGVGATKSSDGSGDGGASPAAEAVCPPPPAPPPAPNASSSANDSAVAEEPALQLEEYHHRRGGFDWLTLLHAWLAVVAFAVAFPLSAATARYARPPAESLLSGAGAGGDCATARRKHWFALHRGAAWVGAACAALSLLLILLRKLQSGHPHLRSLHAQVGLAAIVLAFVQPVVALMRPAKTAGGGGGGGGDGGGGISGGRGGSIDRRALWRASHIACALGLLGAGVYASVTGVQKAAPHGIDGAARYEAALTLWLGAVAVAIVAGEAWRLQGSLRRWLGRAARISSSSRAGAKQMSDSNELSGAASEPL